jgi:hypothetical protein
VASWRGPRATAAFLHERTTRDHRAASVGTLAHDLILGTTPKVMVKTTSWASKEGKEEQRAFLAQAGCEEPEKLVAAETEAACSRAGWGIVSEADMATAHILASRYRDRWGDPMFEIAPPTSTGPNPQPGTEVDVKAEYRDCLLTGRLDLLTHAGGIRDIKVWHDSTFDAVRRRAMTDRVALQLAHYWRMCRLSGWGEDELTCGVHVISSTAPHMTYELILHPEDLDRAVEAHEYAVEELIEWHRAGCPITYDGGSGLLPTREV